MFRKLLTIDTFIILALVALSYGYESDKCFYVAVTIFLLDCIAIYGFRSIFKKN